MSKEESELIETEPMQATCQALDIRDASDQAVKLMRMRVENQKQMLKIAISLTGMKQWTLFGDSVYPTGGAADTILRRAFGLTWGEKEITVEDTKDGKIATCSAWLMLGDKKVEKFTGYRLLGGFAKNEMDLRKDAIENMKSVAVRDILGLRFRTPAELKEIGLDVSKIKTRVEFQDHTDSEIQNPVVPFGKNKGKPIGELSDKSLEWYHNASIKNLEDPSKEKWKRNEEKWFSALSSEIARRAQPDKTETTQKSEQESLDYGPPPMDREPGSDG